MSIRDQIVRTLGVKEHPAFQILDYLLTRSDLTREKKIGMNEILKGADLPTPFDNDRHPAETLFWFAIGPIQILEGFFEYVPENGPAVEITAEQGICARADRKLVLDSGEVVEGDLADHLYPFFRATPRLLEEIRNSAR